MMNLSKNLMLILLTILYSTCKAHDNRSEAGIIQVNFIKSQQISKSESARNPLVYFLRSLYNKYILQDLVYSDQPCIPKNNPSDLVG